MGCADYRLPLKEHLVALIEPKTPDNANASNRTRLTPCIKRLFSGWLQRQRR